MPARPRSDVAKEPMRRREFILALGGAAAVATVPLAAAEEYPGRAITLIVNFPPGGSTDAMARILREPLTQGLGQSIIIDNRGGAGGTTGAAAVANAKPDGYTLLLSVNSSLITNKFLQKNFPFDPRTAFAPITLTSDVALVLAVHPSLPVHDVSELVDYAKKNPGKLAYGSAGIGTMHHIMGELIKQKTGIEMVPVDAGPPRRQREAVFQHVADGLAAGAGRLDPHHRRRREDPAARAAGHAHDRRDDSKCHQYRLERSARTCRNARTDHR
jgi:tripartite-type tricarboxylate transporter receptor subunit TctC